MNIPTILGCTTIFVLTLLYHKRKERELLEYIDRLYRLAEFGRLSAGIFHDLMNSLSAVSLSVEKLRDGGRDSDRDAFDGVDMAVRASRRMEALMRATRKQLRSADSDKEFAIEEEIGSALALLAHKAASSSVRMEADLDGRHMIYGNPSAFFRIVVNLVSNALDSYRDMPASSSAERKISVSVARKGESMEVSVSDVGCGMDERTMRSIFEPFFTTKSEREGMGLGLSVTKRMIEEDFKGAISVKSSPGKGSVFTVLIPRTSASSAPDRTPER